MAVENFVLFKSMMIARNKQLNEEAFKQIGSVAEKDKEKKRLAKERERAEMEQALAESKALEEKKKA